MVRPRYASTVVLVRRDAEGAFEILLTRRPPEMRFMGGFYVFPGGTVHEDDHSMRVLERCRGLSGEQARELLGRCHSGDLALGHWVAVVRELYEEVGVLLCEDERRGLLDLRDAAGRQRFEDKRRALVEGRLSFGEVLESENLFCDLSRISYFFHRVTPELYPMRFDTRFYLATLPSYQTVLASSEEVTDSLWIRPRRALARAYRRLPMLPPTTTVLEQLAAVETWEQLRNQHRLS
jgi:8-oxo-dGTP pyrophosphatase MutT (NUDIX family)